MKERMEEALISRGSPDTMNSSLISLVISQHLLFRLLIELLKDTFSNRS